MDPQDLLAVKLRIVLYILYHKANQIKELLRPDEQMHSHHHIKMADELSRIIPLALQLEEMHQLFSRLILNPYGAAQLFLVKGPAETPLKLRCKFL